MRRHLNQPDRGLDRFDLAEERADTFEIMVSPMLQQSSRFRGHLPLAWGKRSPAVHLVADFVDTCVDVVLLFLRRNPFDVFEHDLLLRLRRLAFLRLGDRCNEFGATTGLDDLLGRLPGFIQFPMAPGTLIRRIQDWVFEERIRHGSLSFLVHQQFQADFENPFSPQTPFADAITIRFGLWQMTADS